MENNVTILSRKVVGLDDCRMLGSMSDLIIEPSSRTVSHFVFEESGTSKGKRIIPFDKIVSIGNSFVVVQTSDDLIEKKSITEKKILSGYTLLQCPVFSKTGDDLGFVEGFEFDMVFGDVTSVTLKDGSKFSKEQFVFFSPEFIFVDDGSALFSELRSQTKPVEEVSETEENEDDSSNDDLASYLVGLTINESVTSEDGSLRIEEGTLLTEETVNEARRHNMLIALTMAVD